MLASSWARAGGARASRLASELAASVSAASSAASVAGRGAGRRRPRRGRAGRGVAAGPMSIDVSRARCSRCWASSGPSVPASPGDPARAEWYRAISACSVPIAPRSTATSGAGRGRVPSPPTPLQPAATSGTVITAAASTLRRLRSARTAPPVAVPGAPAERRRDVRRECPAGRTPDGPVPAPVPG